MIIQTSYLEKHKPTSKATIRKLLKVAAVTKSNRLVNAIHVRLGQAIPGCTCPFPLHDIAYTEKSRKLDRYYVRVFLEERRRIGYHAKMIHELIYGK